METNDFLRALWRGGAWAYYWRIDAAGKKQSLWFPAGKLPGVPAQWDGSNVYMGVNTTAAKGPAHRRALATPDADKLDAPPVALCGCLFAEWDAKDFDGGKEAILAHIDTLWAQGQGLPWPSVLVDSGGGYHGYWLLEEPLSIDDGNRAAVMHVQAAWVTLWGGDDGAKDIARILRLPGTMNYKYDPPRPVTIHPDSNTSRTYTWADLVALLPTPSPRAVATVAPVTVKVQSDGGKRAQAYGAAALQKAIDTVAGATEGRNNTVYGAAKGLGQLVGGGVMAETGLLDALTDAGVRAGLPEAEARRAATNGLRKGKDKPRSLPDTAAVHMNGNGAPEDDVPPPWLDDDAPPDPPRKPHGGAQGMGTLQLPPAPERRTQWTAADLLRAEFPEPRWVVPGLLTVGLGFLAGRPKLGKSWLALQLAVAVGCGGVFLGQHVERRKVLYLALEDNERRMQSRMRKQGAPADVAIDFYFETAPLMGQGAIDLHLAIRREGYHLVIIDTFGRALGRADQNDLAAMSVASGALQRMAISEDILILLVDHHRKSISGGGVGDVIDDVMGSSGKAAAADVALGLYRQRGQRDAVLKLVGRDVEEAELAVKFDRDLGCWQLLGNVGDVRADTVQAEILAALVELGRKSNAAEIARYLDKRPNNITRELQELVTAGRVIRGEREGHAITYGLPREPKS